MTLGLSYAVISPVILPFVALYFALALPVYRHQVHHESLPFWLLSCNSSFGRCASLSDHLSVHECSGSVCECLHRSLGE